MSELRAGGVALIIRSLDPSDVGKCVTLISVIDAGEDFVSPSGLKCHSGKSKSSWLVTGDICAEAREPHRHPKCDFYGWGLYEADRLMPIDGEDFSDEDIYEKDIERSGT